MRSELKNGVSVLMGLWALSILTGCAAFGPRIEDRYTVHTPIFADNRVYHLAPATTQAPNLGKQQLRRVGENAGDDADVVKPNEPLSIIMRSIEIPAKEEKGPIDGPADYAVILDVGTAADGSSKSLVVWYQRGVQPDQSLNFSNLLVYYEPRWDERVAPFFRVRVMDVTKERNEETRRTLERVHGISGALASFATTPIAAPLIGIAFTAAELVLANRENRLLLDYSVQLYSSSAQAQAGSGRLGALKKGSYIVVGRPNEEGRAFWTKEFWFEPESRVLDADNRRVNVPMSLLTVGTFESIVPTLVLERSKALMELLSGDPGKTAIEQVGDAGDRLGASIRAYVLGEKLKRYKDIDTLNRGILKVLESEDFKKLLGAEDVFHLVRAINGCLKPEAPFTSIDEVRSFVATHRPASCKK